MTDKEEDYIFNTIEDISILGAEIENLTTEIAYFEGLENKKILSKLKNLSDMVVDVIDFIENLKNCE